MNTDPRTRTGPDMSWCERANCKHIPTELFFGDFSRQKYRSGRPPSTGKRTQVIPAELIEACDTCPVRDKCLAHAVKHFERGWWGGTTEDDRRLMRPDGAHRQRIEAGMALYNPYGPTADAEKKRQERARK